jgi:hypothetical protein
VLEELGAKFGVRDTRGILLVPESAHSDLADMIGTSRPMVSRLISEVTEEGLLLRQGRQFILLKSLSGETSESLSPPTNGRGSFPNSSPQLVGRPPFKHSVVGRNGRLALASVVSTSRKYLTRTAASCKIHSGTSMLVKAVGSMGRVNTTLMISEPERESVLAVQGKGHWRL